MRWFTVVIEQCLNETNGYEGFCIEQSALLTCLVQDDASLQ